MTLIMPHNCIIKGAIPANEPSKVFIPPTEKKLTHFNLLHWFLPSIKESLHLYSFYFLAVWAPDLAEVRVF